MLLSDAVAVVVDGAVVVAVGGTEAGIVVIAEGGAVSFPVDGVWM